MRPHVRRRAGDEQDPRPASSGADAGRNSSGGTAPGKSILGSKRDPGGDPDLRFRQAREALTPPFCSLPRAFPRAFPRITFGTSTTFGCEVDQGTGDVWLTELSAGNVALLDPATAVLTRWNVGGTPAYVTQDGLGNVYATVDNGPGGDQIVKIDPATNTVTRWLIPGSFAVAGFETPNGIVVDSAGNVWFVESGSNSIGRLNPGTDEICQFTKVGISRPQLIATSGSGALRQVFFTESTGNSVSVLSEAEAVGVCATVTPSTSTVTPTTPTVSRGTLIKPAREFVIIPETFVVPGVDGGAPPSGLLECVDSGELIPGILRFSPMPTGTGGFGANNPSGMTRVAPAQTIHGSYIGPDQVFRLESCAIIAPPETPDGAPVLLVIDEDSIDSGNPPNNFSDTDVNDDIAGLGVRTQLPFFAANVGQTITLHTGEVGDEGWFAPKTVPDSWADAGPTADGPRIICTF